MGLPVPAVGTRFKATYFISKSTGGQPEGWSESYYLVSASYTEGLGDMQVIWNARKATLAQDCVLVYAYISDLAIRGDSLLFSSSTGTFGTFGDEHTFTLPPWNVLQARFESTALYHVIRPFRGIPSSASLVGETPVNPEKAAYLTFFAVLAVKTYLRIKEKGNDPARIGQFRPIMNYYALRYRERKAGRPFGLLRGRSKPRSL